jgi:hypothetical protein
MTFSESFLAGFALAATIAKDAGAEQARAGLCDASAATLTGAARKLRALSKAERRAQVSAWIRAQAGQAPASATAGSHAVVWPRVPAGPLRAYALLAQRMPASAAPQWLHDIPLPRAGYTPPPQLVERLARCLQTRVGAGGESCES